MTFARRILVLSLVWISIPTVTAQTIRDIENAWKKREAELPSGQVHWTEHVVYVKGSLTELVQKAAQPRNNPDVVVAGGEFPAEDVTVDNKKSLCWAGPRMRFSAEEWLVSFQRLTFVKNIRDEVAGGRSGSLGLMRNESMEYPIGAIYKETALASRQAGLLTPLLLWVRPLDSSGSAIDLAQCKLATGGRRIHDRNCVILSRVSGATRDEWIIDPLREFVVLRYDRESNGKTLLHAEIDYSGASGTWRPVAWRVLQMNLAGALNTDCKSHVESCAITDVVGERTFELSFPVGTWVHDNREGDDFIVTAQQPRRYVTRGETRRGATYSELLHSPSGLATLSTGGNWRRVVVSLAALALVCSSGWFVLRRLQRR